MKTQKKIKEGISKGAKFAMAATLLSVPMFTTMPQDAFSQKFPSGGSVAKKSSPASIEKQHYTIKLTNANVARIVGIESGKTVYQNDKEEYFTLDPKTGDMKFLSSDIFIKIESSSSASKFNFQKIKMEDTRVTLLGIDDKGRTIHQNKKGDKFYLDTKTGDMIFIK